MKIEQLVQVIEIAKTRSITLAAKNLYMSQSNLSTSIRELEKEMKQNIFVRSNNGTQLTSFGEAFLIQARSVVKQFEYIKSMSSNQDKWNIKFNVSSYYFLFAVYIFLDLFHNNRNQNMAFELRECSRSEIIQSVADKESELGILSIPTLRKSKWLEFTSRKELEYHKIIEEPAHILIGENSPLNQEFDGSVNWEDLKYLPMIDFREPQGAFNGMEDQYLDILEPDTIIHVSDRDSLIRFLNTTGCYHIATKNLKAYREFLYHESIKAIPITDCPFSLEIGWIKEKNSYLSELGKQFLIKTQELLILENPPILQL